MTLPLRASEPFNLQDIESGAEVKASLLDTIPATGDATDGYVVYPRAHASGATVMHRALPSGTEDLIAFDSRPSHPEVVYHLTLGESVAGLRLVGGSLEMLDSKGVPRLRVAPPYIVGADGETTDAELSVEGCKVDTNSAPPWGRRVKPPEAKTCLMRVAWHDAGVAYPAILDPRWTTTGSMATARQEHTATLLPNGKVLVAGGRSTSGTTGLATAELYDPATGLWTSAGTFSGARRLHSATLLGSSPTAKVLIAGGISGSTSLNTAQLYSTSTGWSGAGNLNTPRHAHSATLLANGKVLLAGGLAGTATLQTAALYTPSSGAGTFAPTTGPIPPPGLRAHTATLIQTTNNQLRDKVLLAGGNTGSATTGAVFLFDPVQSAFSTLQSMPGPREQHTAVTLSGGRILVAGGKNGSATLDSAVMFDPGTGPGSWAPAGTMTSRRVGHTATLLPTGVLTTGQVLIAGGSNGTNTLDTAEVFSGTNTWTATALMTNRAQGHTATLLGNNRVLVAGGLNGSNVLTASSLYDPALGLACTSPGQCASGHCVNGVCCDTACSDQQCNACNLSGKVGICSPKSNGTTCSDGNACTQTDACQAGTCAGSNPVVCTAQDQCHVAGTCAPATGLCSNPNASNGIACNDGDSCTQTETCQAGVCQPPQGQPTILELPVEDLGSLGGVAVAAEDINRRGDVVGSAHLPSGEQHAFFRPKGEPMIDINPSRSGVGSGINNEGWVTGHFNLPIGSRAFRRDPSNGGLQDLGFVGDGSVSTQDQGVPIQGSFGRDINNAKQVAGFFTTGGAIHGFRFSDEGEDGLYEDIGTLAGGMTFASAIDDDGAVVGSSWVPGTPNTNDIRRLGHAVMFLDEEEGLIDLNGVIPPGSGWILRQATDIAGDFVVGTGELNGRVLPFRLHLPTGDIDEISGGWQGFTFGNGVNRFGDVIGWGFLDTANTQAAAFVFSDRFGFKKLDEIVDPTSGWNLRVGTSINDLGEVVGSGFHDGENRSFLVSTAPQAVTCGSSTTCGGPSGAICIWSDGIAELGDGRYVAIFGFANSSSTSIRPTTNEVRLDGTIVTNPAPAPPQWLAPGSHPGGYLPTFDAGHTISWTVDGKTVTASVSPSSRVLPTEPIGSTGLGVRIGDTLVTIRPDLSPPPAQTEPEHVTPFNGALTGTFSVSPSGAATYTVPISITPGIAGVAPNLSLVYNSQGGMGIAGQGWELAGLSMVHRCPKTKVQDGFGHQVSMRISDQLNEALCIDGKRLFPQNAEPAVTQVYELEQDDHSTITRIKDDPDHTAPLRTVGFKVVTKTGETRYYGRTPSTRVDLAVPGEAEAQTAIWALERVVDQFGNYFDVQYNEGATNFATEGIQVSAIHYTAHFPGTSGLGETEPFAHVRFQYEPRREKRSVRFGSVTLPRTKRLKRIATSAGVYTLNYLPDYVRGQPYGLDRNAMLPTRLSSIGYCALDNVTCVKPLDFVWDGGGYDWDEIAAFAPPEPLNHPPGKGSGAVFPDLDGDGRADFVRSYGGSSSHDEIAFSEAWRNTGQGFVAAPASWNLPAAVVEEDGELIGATFADMDGDGLVDFVTRELVPCGPGGLILCSSHPAVWLNRIKQGAGWQRATGFDSIPAPWSSDFGPFVQLNGVDQIVDMNADGKADLVRFGPGDFQVQVKYSTGSGWEASPENYNIEVLGMQLTNVLNMKLDDINRDGLPDVVWKHGSVLCSNIRYGINTGKNHRGHPTSPIEAVWQVEIADCGAHAEAPPDKRLVGDIDGDGFRDVVSPFRARLNHSTIGQSCSQVCSCPAGCSVNTICFQGSCSCSCPSSVTVTNDPQVILATGSNWTSNGADPFLTHLFDFEPHAGESSIPPSKHEDFVFSMADLNADGLADAIINHVHDARPEGRGQLLVNTGGGFEELEGALDWNANAGIVDVRLVPRVPTSDEDFGQMGRMFIDLNGDGVTDLVDSSNASGQFITKAWVNRFRPPVIKHFPNGLARASEVTYSVITTAEATQDGTYWDSPVAAEGTTFFAPPLRVVKSVLAEDGTATGTMFSTDYQYTSLRAGADGRGPQGFASLTVIDQRPVSATHPNARKITETQFAQHYPYTGMAKLVRRYVDYGATHPSLERAYLTETATDYCAMQEDGTLQCDDDGIVDYDENTSLFVHPKKVTDTTHLYDFDVEDRLARTRMVRITDYDYDTDGNPTLTKVTTEVREGQCGSQANPCSRHEKTVTNFYEAPPGSLIPTATLRRFGKVTRTIVNSDGNVTSGDGRMHTTEFDYIAGPFYVPPGESPQRGIVLGKTRVEPGRGAPLELHTAYRYDEFGNVTETLECPTSYSFCLPGTPTGSTPFRSTRMSFRPVDFTPPPGGRVSGLAYENGRFPVMTENALGHREYVAYHPVFGVPVQKTGPDGVHKCFEYDVFGRVTREIDRCGSTNELTTSTDRFVPIAWDPQQAKTVTRTRAPTGVATWNYGDAFGRTTVTRGRTFDGGFSETFTVHDHLGRTTQESVPRKLSATGPAFLTTTIYDEADRVTSIVRDLASIDGTTSTRTAIRTFTYEGMKILTEQFVEGQNDPQTHLETKNVIGKVQSVVDSNGTTVSYIYDPDGNLTDVDAFEGSDTTHVEYDIRGRRTLLRDPDMGEWHYTHTGFGELETQTDAEQRTLRNTYDKLGRQTVRRDEQTGEEARWVYDVAPGVGIGKLAAMVSEPDEHLAPCDAPHGLPSGEQRAVRSFTYTQFGDVEDEIDCTDGTSFFTSRSYDQYGRPSLITYPQVGTSRLTLRTNYTPLGFLHSVSDMEDESLVWTATARDAAGSVTGEYAGNGVETTSVRNPATGWLMASESVAHDEGDTVIQRWAQEYDEVGNLRRRLRTDVVNGAASEELFTYDPLNRLRTSTVRIGSDQYDETYDMDLRGNITSKAGKPYTYGAAGGCATGGPHAVCTFDGSEQFVYDANGNMTSGAGRTVSYNLDNKVEHIEDGASAVDFVYGADGQRVVQEVAGSGPTARTVYVGLGGTGKSLYERTSRDGTVEHTHFLYAGSAHGGNAFAIKVTEESQGAEVSSSLSFYHSDHLGSVTAMSDEGGHVVNAAEGGAAATAAGYNPWGARRSPDGRPADPVSFEPLPGHREFTAHETIPYVGLINMNGRVYDPELGRFLTPDPNVTFVADLQSYNRYAYVLNNPLRYTDPTGFIPLRDGAPFDAFGAAYTFILGLSTTAACGVSGPACAVGYVMLFSYSATTMATSGASFEDIILANAIGIGAGAIGGAAGDALARGLGGGAGAQIIGGMYADMISKALTTAVTGGNIDSGDLLWELWTGAMSSAFEAGATSALVSQAYAADARGQRGTAGRQHVTSEWEQQQLDEITDRVKHDAKKAGDVEKATIGALPVAVFGGTPEQRKAAMEAAWKILNGSPHGRTMRQALEARTWKGNVKTLEIVLTFGTGGSSMYRGTELLTFDLQALGERLPTKSGKGVWTYERIIAHELGHGAMGARDIDHNGRTEMFNIDTHENPVMRELGDSDDRTAYYTCRNVARPGCH